MELINIKDEIHDFEQGYKSCGRTVSITLPLPVKEIVNKGLYPNTIEPESVNEAEHFEREVEVFDDKIVVNLYYFYREKASEEEIKAQALLKSREMINNLRENLKLLCDKFEVSMDELMELQKDE